MVAEMHVGAGRSRSGQPESARAAGDDELDALLEAHCRHVQTLLPRGVLGAATAAAIIAAVPKAHRSGLPDLTGSAPAILADLVTHGLLAGLPSKSVLRAVPRLLAPLTPIVEARSPKTWTFWLANLASPAMLREIRRRTPLPQLAVTPGLTGTAPHRRRRDVVANHKHLEDELAAATDACHRLASRLADAEKRCEALSRANANADATRDRLLLEAAALQGHLDKQLADNQRLTRESAELQRELTSLKSRYRLLELRGRGS